MLWACTLLSGGLLWRAGPLRDSTCARHGGNKTSLKHETSRARERHTNFAPQASHRASPVRPISLRSPAPCLPPCCPGHAPRRLRQLHLGRLSSRNHSSSMDFGYFRSSRVAAGCGASTSDRARSLSASGIDAARAGFDPTLGTELDVLGNKERARVGSLPLPVSNGVHKVISLANKHNSHLTYRQTHE